MFFPIRTDRKLQHTPWVNYAVIAANVIVFLLMHSNAQLTGDIQSHYMLFPTRPALLQFITYQFLHQGWGHLVGNMLFLYVFGNGVEDRLGKVGYLAFYLGGGVLAGLGHMAVSSSPVLGASGSVAAVTGLYLFLFPLSNVTIVYWFVFVGAFEISSIVLILFQIGQNVVMHLFGGSQVAYMAHLAGYSYGIVVGAGLLWTRLLPREPYDLLALIEQKRHRRQFHRMTHSGFEPWRHGKAGRPVPAQCDPPAISDDEARQMELRSQISQSLGRQDLPQAAHLYQELLELDDDQVMNQQQQLDIANELMSESRYDLAARAYELFLSAFKTYTSREQVELILGLIYVKYLERKHRGRELLTASLPKLHDPHQKQLAQNMLKEIES